MTAQEMFYKLGYHVNYKSKTMLVYTQLIPDTNIQEVITFNGSQKKVYVGYRYTSICKGVDVSLLKAINQQVKELGWVEK